MLKQATFIVLDDGIMVKFVDKNYFEYLHFYHNEDMEILALDFLEATNENINSWEGTLDLAEFNNAFDYTNDNKCYSLEDIKEMIEGTQEVRQNNLRDFIKYLK
jgi:hypothetical protein